MNANNMFQYYVTLAVRSLRRNLVLTVLMVAAIGVGIGASMTTLTVFRAMSADPIPDRSSVLFAPQIDNWGPHEHQMDTSDKLEDQIDYVDAMAIVNAHQAEHQNASYAVAFALTPENRDLMPFRVEARATFTDFFPMFEVPFRYGSAWSASDDANHTPVAVISRDLNDKLFGGRNSVGRTLNLDNQSYRVVGVLDQWDPIPRFYDLTNSHFNKSEDLFVPFTHAIDRHLPSNGNTNCSKFMGSGWEARLQSTCVWIQVWVELPDWHSEKQFKHWLDNYAAEQQRIGRFQWPPHTALRDLREWLSYEHVVSNEARILVLVSFSFLLVCVLNAMGLMLARFMGRAPDIGVRRALGASRRAIMMQCLIEAGVVGLAGGLLGLLLTALGLLGLRSVLSDEILRLTHMDLTGIAIALALAILATVIAALYPTWRAAQVQPAWQLKAP